VDRLEPWPHLRLFRRKKQKDFHAGLSNPHRIVSVLPYTTISWESRGPFDTGFKADEFCVLENGRQQELTIFEVGKTPVTVGLVVDRSRSIGSKLPGLAAAENSTSAPMEKEAK